VLTDGSYRREAQRIAGDIATYEPARIAAELIERLAETGQPVLRGSLAATAESASVSPPARHHQ
jgi:hypothetical protein